MRFAWAFVMLCATAGILSASTRKPLDVAARARSAGKIIVATVTDVEPGRFDVNPFGDQVIATRAWLDVEETLKGSQEQVVAIDVEGGSVGDLVLQVSDMPTLKPGERAMFFLTPGPGGAHTPNGRGQGILKLDANGRITDQDLTLGELKARVQSALRQ